MYTHNTELYILIILNQQYIYILNTIQKMHVDFSIIVIIKKREFGVERERKRMCLICWFTLQMLISAVADPKPGIKNFIFFF